MTLLKQAFLHYRHLHFRARHYRALMPRHTPVRFMRMARGKMGECGYYGGPYCEIRINNKIKEFGPAWRSTLLHEMGHLVTCDEKAGHGKRWNAEMKRLLKRGAFDKLL